MFFLETPPDTSGYMVAGYAIAFGVMLLYIFSVFLRFRSLEQELTVLEDLDDDKA